MTNDEVAAFTARVRADISGGVVTLLCGIGDRLGLFADLAEHGAATSSELASRTDLHERYLREWLSALACAGYLAYAPETGRFSLPPAHVPALAEEGTFAFRGGMFEMFPTLAVLLDRLSLAFKDGGGVPASAYDEHFYRGEERLNAAVYNHLLVQEIVPAVPAAEAALTRGAVVADVGCGTGAAIVAMARAFPNSRFVGYDLHAPNLDRARASASAAGVADRVRFEVADIDEGVAGSFDLITSFLVVHDAPHPDRLLRGIHAALAPGGNYLWCLDSVESDRLEDHFGPLGALWYGTSLLYCLPTVRAAGGEGLGSMGLSVSRMKDLAGEAGFRVFRPVQTASGLVDVFLLEP